MPLQATSGAASYDAFGGGVPVVPNYIEEVFSTWLYTGNGSTQTITNGIDLAGKGGLVWCKGRNLAGYNNSLMSTAFSGMLFSDATNAASDYPTDINSYNTNGFTLKASTNYDNISGTNYASWTFRKQPKFFDVVTYTGNGVGGNTISHNLGSVPACIIFKRTDSTSDWSVYHRSLSGFIVLNSTNAQTGSFDSLVNNITSTSFAVQSSTRNNANGGTYVAYIFAHDAGGFGLTGTDNVISCGSYTEGSSDVTVSLGYEPAWILVKPSSTSGNWNIYDTMRGAALTGNTAVLRPNTSDAEAYPANYWYPTSTGFVAKSGNYGSGQPIVYIAIRRGPMKVPTTGTSVFSPIARSGTGATSTVSNNITTDLIISMTRNTGQSSGVWDRLRGVTKYLETTGTASESTSSDSVTALNNNAYVLGADSATDRINRSGYTYANWTFSRAPSFFDVVCYTGNGTSTPFNHNLGVTPELIITKIRDSGTPNWGVWHKDFSPFAAMAFLNTTAVPADGYVNAVSSTQFSFATGSGVVNTSTRPYVAYLFATCAGVSKVGSYTGNGSSQTINCGFTGGSRFILIKQATVSNNEWFVWDSARGIVSGNDPFLTLNRTWAEDSSTDSVDTDSTGFIVNQNATTSINSNGAVYVFLAIA